MKSDEELKADVEAELQWEPAIDAAHLGVAVELEVKIPFLDTRTDTELAQAAQSALACNVVIPKDMLRVKVEKGWLTLSGELDWEFQRNAAMTAVRSLKGVVGVTNSITIKPRTVASDIGSRIGAALWRHALREAKDIRVDVTGSAVALRGRIDSWAERRAAEGAAWSAPGVTRVVNELAVG